MALVQADVVKARFDRKQIEEAYQPIVDLAPGNVVAGDLGPDLERRYLLPLPMTMTPSS